MKIALYYDLNYIHIYIYKKYFLSSEVFFLHLKPDQLLLKYHPEKSIHVGSYSKNTNIRNISGHTLISDALCIAIQVDSSSRGTAYCNK